MKADTSKAFIDYRTPEYDKEMRAYIQHLRKTVNQKSIEEAREGLKRTGVADKNGHVKKKIVSWN